MAAPLGRLAAVVCSKTNFLFTGRNGISRTSVSFGSLSSIAHRTTCLTSNRFENNLFSESRNGKRQSHDKHGQSKHTYPMLASALAFTLFGKKKEEEEPIKVVLEEDPEKTKEEDYQPEQLTTMLKKAKLAQFKEEYQEAEKLYHNALGVLNIYEHHSAWEPDKIKKARVWVWDAMAEMSFVRQRFEVAEKCYKDAMRGLIDVGYEQTHNAIVEMSLKLAMIFAVTQRAQEALQGYEFCIDTQMEKILKNEQPEPQDKENTLALLGLCLDAYSRFLLSQKDYPLALKNLQKALDVAEKVFGEFHPQIAVLHNDIATVATYTNDFKLAMDHVKQAIAVGEKVEADELSIYYRNHGIISLQSRDFTSATISCEKAFYKALSAKDAEGQAQAKKCLETIKQVRNKKK